MTKTPPPTREAWLIDGELRGGHTLAETLAYLDWASDYEDQVSRHALPTGVISPSGVRRGLLARLRRR